MYEGVVRRRGGAVLVRIVSDVWFVGVGVLG